MNFRRKIMCIGLLGLFMRSVAGDIGAAAVVREVPQWYKDLFWANSDACGLAGGIITEDMANILSKIVGYTKEHYLASGLSAAVLAYLLYYYRPKLTFGESLPFGGLRQRLGGWFRYPQQQPPVGPLYTPQQPIQQQIFMQQPTTLTPAESAQQAARDRLMSVSPYGSQPNQFGGRYIDPRYDVAELPY